MAESLSPECTPLKGAYDACFNAWFEGYLEPAVAVAGGFPTPEQRQAYSKQKAAEFEEKCGAIWQSYKACIQKAVEANGLDVLLQQAREENPLMESPSIPPTSSTSSGSRT